MSPVYLPFLKSRSLLLVMVGTLIACGSSGNQDIATRQPDGSEGNSGTNSGGSSGSGGSTAGQAGVGSQGTGGSSGVSGTSGTSGTGSGGGASGTAGTSGIGGASGTGGTSGASGTGGTAGAPVELCSAIVGAGDPRLTALTSDQHQQKPSFALDDNLGNGEVLLMASLSPVESPGPVPPQLAHTTFSPWGVWPDSGDLATFQTSSNVGGDSFLVGNTSPGHFSLAYASPIFLSSIQPGIYMHPSLSSQGTMMAAPMSMVHANWVGTIPLALRVHSSGKQSLVAFQTDLDFMNYTMGIQLVDGDQPLAINGDIACATESVEASIVSVSDGFLIAYTTSRPFQTCSDDNGVNGPPAILEVVHVSPIGEVQLRYAQTMDQGVPYRFAKLLPRINGFWLVWYTEGGVVPAPVLALPLDKDGKILPGATPKTLLQGGFTYAPPAFSSLGGQIVMAYRDDTGQVTKLGVKVFDLKADPIASSFANVLDLYPTGLSVLGSAQGDKVLVAWPTVGGAFDSPSQIAVQRFDCIQPELQENILISSWFQE
jgi:hypothetical protein